MGLLAFLSGCGGQAVQHYKGMNPPLDLQTYFTGPIKAWGFVQDYSGKVTRRFDVEMVGTWNGDVGTLEEKFKYYDVETHERIWTLKKIDHDGKYFKVHDAYLEPKPIQKPHPPIWIGGTNRKTLKLIGERGDGWLPGGSSPKIYNRKWVFFNKLIKTFLT